MQRTIAVFAFLFIAAPALASGPVDHWRVVNSSGGVEVRARPLADTPLQEYLAVTTFEGTVAEIRDVVTDVAAFARFMPHVKEARVLERPKPAVEIAYVHYDMPWPLHPRDYVTERTTERDLAPDGSGEYWSHWSALPQKIPAKAGMVRLTRNDGYWHLSPDGPHKVHVEFDCAADPGGSLPPFAVNVATGKTLPELLKAVQAEVLRRNPSESL